MLKKIKQHIALFLPLLMVFPSINNTLHFSLKDHHRTFENRNFELVFNLDNVEHICSQDLFSLSTFVDISFQEKNTSIRRISQKIISFYDESVPSKITESLSIRGPPRIT